MRLTAILNTLGLLALVALGIALFFMREQKVPTSIAHELRIQARTSTQRIVSDQFLVLINPSHIAALPDILDPLALELKMPILNWLLVGKKDENNPDVVGFQSEVAEETRLTLSSLQQHPYVLDAQHNFIVDPTALPKNRSFAKEWQLHNASSAEPLAMNLPLAWGVTKGSKNVTIAVVDRFTRLGNFTFPERFLDCQNRVTFLEPLAHLKSNASEDSLPHGEIILHALGACTNSDAFSTGIDWHANILAVERPSLGHAQSFLAALIASGIDICRQSIAVCPNNARYVLPKKPPDVLLLPFGNNAPDLLQFSADMISAIHSKNVMVVSGAGNEKTNADSFFPGASPGVINVGALNRKGTRADFSNWGKTIDLLAPGDDIELSYPNGQKSVAGTSLAAAYVTGAISLMKSINKHLSFEQAKYFLMKSARPLTCEQYCPRAIMQATDGCESLCCHGNQGECGSLALDINNALRMTQNNELKTPLLTLNKYYLLHLRDEITPKTIVVGNEGDEEAYVSTLVYDDNIQIAPEGFRLAKKGARLAEQTVLVSFKREPFKRQTSKIVFLAKSGAQVLNRAEFYLEYIPKK